MIFLVIFLVLLTMSTPLSADEFDFNGNTLHSYFRNAITYTLGDINTVKDGGWKVVFDESLLEGEYTEDIDSFSMQNITDVNIPEAEYKIRIPGLLDRVSGPPGTVVDVTYFYYNLTGHDVELEKILVPYSKDDATQGNLLNICSFKNVSPVWDEISLVIGIKERRRYSFFSQYTVPGIIGSGLEGRLLLERMEIKDPLEVSNVEYKYIGGEYHITVEIENVGNERLDNLELRHGSFANLFSLDIGEILSLEYTISNEEVNDVVEVLNNSWRTECSNIGGAPYNWADEEAITVFVQRAGRIDAGAYLQPSSDGFCVTRTPYSLMYELSVFGKEEELFPEDLPQKQDEEDSVGSVLGAEDFSENTSVLPFTAMW